MNDNVAVEEGRTRTNEEFLQRLAALPMSRSEFAALSGIKYRHVQRWATEGNPILQWAWALLEAHERIKLLEAKVAKTHRRNPND